MKTALVAAAVIAAASLGAGAAGTREQSVAGTWTFMVEHFGLKLELAQKKNAVTGTLDWPHGDPIKLTGAFSGNTLTFGGDSTGENFSVRIDSTGTLEADGTLKGTLRARFVDFNDAHEVVKNGIRRSHGRPRAANTGLCTSLGSRAVRPRSIEGHRDCREAAPQGAVSCESDAPFSPSPLPLAHCSAPRVHRRKASRKA